MEQEVRDGEKAVYATLPDLEIYLTHFYANIFGRHL